MRVKRSRNARLAASLGAGLLLMFAGCGGNHSALNPAGVQAGEISNVWWFFFWVATIIYLMVLSVTIGVIVRGKIRRPLATTDKDVVVLAPASESRVTVVVASAVGLTLIILLLLLSGDVFAGAALHSLGSDKPVSIRVTGHQWWWEVQYNSPDPSQTVYGANEIHLPVRAPVQLQLNSSDVIHSFWVPNLHGKKDLIPGHPTALWLRADRAGVFLGQCAEFCGVQHAHMRLRVFAEEQESFGQWLAEQREPAAEPANETQKRGQHVFLTGTCVMCHTIQGTIAGARLGPDLTHVASRQTLAAGRLRNNRGNLAGWILDPQHLKPGVRMPQNQLSSQDLHALLDYMESLK